MLLCYLKLGRKVRIGWEAEKVYRKETIWKKEGGRWCGRCCLCLRSQYGHFVIFFVGSEYSHVSFFWWNMTKMCKDVLVLLSSCFAWLYYIGRDKVTEQSLKHGWKYILLWLTYEWCGGDWRIMCIDSLWWEDEWNNLNLYRILALAGTVLVCVKHPCHFLPSRSHGGGGSWDMHGGGC